MNKPPAATSYHLFNNSRFYVLVSSVLFSLVVVGWTRLSTPSDQLFYIRTEQVFGLLAMAYWYVALMISPVGYVIGKQRMVHITFMRRAIGVSAAYFALLHLVVSLWGQLGGPAALGYLPPLFKWSLVGGGIALIILLMMAATSFDAVIRFMTFRRWKWLHRLGYIGLVLVILHIWTIGTHVEYADVRVIGFVALALLSGLETFRVVTLLAKQYKWLQPKDYFFALFAAIWAVWLILIVSLPAVVQTYHGQHGSSQEGHVHE